jgi:hypothetical protein
MNELVKKKEYIMYLSAYEEDKLIHFYKGIFIDSAVNSLMFINVIEMKSESSTLFGHSGNYVSMKRTKMAIFTKNVYTFHDVDKVKENAKRAIQRMEKRALDMILKRIVNEHFEWA